MFLRRLAYLLLLLCLLAWLHFSHPYAQGYWLIWSTLLFSLITAGSNLWQRINLIIMAGSLASIGAFIAGLTAGLFPFGAIFLFLLILFSSYFYQKNYPAYIVILSINLLVLLSGLQAIPFPELLIRCGFIFLGSLLAALIHIIFIWHYRQHQLRAWLIITLRNLKYLSEEIFACFLLPEYSQNVYLFEKRIHTQKEKYLHGITQLYPLCINEIDQAVIQRIENIFSLLLDASQMRYRVKDATLYEVCKQDLTAINAEIENIFNQFIQLLRQQDNATLKLEQRTSDFENTYLNFLQVAAQDPLVLLLFVNSLKNLTKEFDGLSKDLNIIKQESHA